MVALLREEGNRVTEDDLRVHIFCSLRRIGEVIADIAHIGSTKHRVTDGVYQHVCIAMAVETTVVGYLDTSQPEVAPLHQSVDIISKSYPYHYLRLNKSLTPSRSNESEKRSVWSSGLLLAVAMT